MPVDRWMCLDFHFTVNLCLTGQANFFADIAEHLQAEQWIQPLPDSFQDSFAAAVLLAAANDHITAAACAEPHTVDDAVRAGIQLDSVSAGDRPEIFAVLSFDGNLFVDKLHGWHCELTLDDANAVE